MPRREKMVGLPGTQYLLRWNDHLSNYGDIFLTLREEEDFIDCSVACEDGMVGAHRVVLAGCSPYLRDIFSRVDNPHPVIFLHNTPRSLVLLLMEYIYRGQVHIPQNRLHQLVTLGRSLKIKGLTQIMMPVRAENQQPPTESGSTVEGPVSDSLTPMAFPHGLPVSAHSGIPFPPAATGVSNNISILSCDNGQNKQGDNEKGTDNGGLEDMEGEAERVGGGGVGGMATTPTSSTPVKRISDRVKKPFVQIDIGYEETPKTKKTKSSPAVKDSSPKDHQATKNVSPTIYHNSHPPSPKSYKKMTVNDPLWTPCLSKRALSPPKDAFKVIYKIIEQRKIGAYVEQHGFEKTKKFVMAAYNVSIRDKTIQKCVDVYNGYQVRLQGQKKLAKSKHNDAVVPVKPVARNIQKEAFSVPHNTQEPEESKVHYQLNKVKKEIVSDVDDDDDDEVCLAQLVKKMKPSNRR